jgi:hypothetical protein
MNNPPKILNKDGTLSQHSFSIGWKEVYKTKWESDDKMVIEKESNSFRVKLFIGDAYAASKTFKTIKEARSYARRCAKFDHVKLP